MTIEMPCARVLTIPEIQSLHLCTHVQNWPVNCKIKPDKASGTLKTNNIILAHGFKGSAHFISRLLLLKVYRAQILGRH